MSSIPKVRSYSLSHHLVVGMGCFRLWPLRADLAAWTRVCPPPFKAGPAHGSGGAWLWSQRAGAALHLSLHTNSHRRPQALPRMRIELARREDGVRMLGRRLGSCRAGVGAQGPGYSRPQQPEHRVTAALSLGDGATVQPRRVSRADQRTASRGQSGLGHQHCGERAWRRGPPPSVSASCVREGGPPRGSPCSPHLRLGREGPACPLAEAARRPPEPLCPCSRGVDTMV